MLQIRDDLQMAMYEQVPSLLSLHSFPFTYEITMTIIKQLSGNPHQTRYKIYQRTDLNLKTLFNIVEAPFNNNCWTMMSVLCNDVQKGQ